MMPILSGSWRLPAVAAVFCCAMAAASVAEPVALTAAGLPMGAPAATGATIAVAVDEGQVMRLDRVAKQVFVANPDIADIQVPQARTILVLGKKPGRTTIIALDEQGGTISRTTVVVGTSLAAMQERLGAEYPRLDIGLESTPTSLIVSGKAETPDQARGIVELVKAYAPDPAKVVNRLSVTSEVQVHLRVHVAEMSRQVVNDVGINWQAIVKSGSNVLGLATGRADLISSGLISRTTSSTGTTEGAVVAGIGGASYSVDAVLDLLGEEGLASVLAEPTLTAISGQTASFLAGGEIPVVTTSGLNGTSVTYKEYGIRLNFTPTVMSHDRISLHVRPEVSQLTDIGAVSTDGITIPALSTRRVDTTVELGSGDSFVIGGLLKNSSSNRNSRIPGLGDLPILGKLFQSKKFLNEETELVVLVTPFIVAPVKPKALAEPSQPFRADAEVERLMAGPRGEGMAPQPPARLYGHAGFVY